MPNWVANYVEIQAKGKKLETILQTIQRDGDVLGSIDFNKLIPMPESLNVTSGSITGRAISAYLSHLKNLDPNALDTQPSEFIFAHQAAKAIWTTLNSRMTEDEIAASAEKHQMSAEAFIALGKQYVDNQKQYGAPTWYEWSTRNWGTKWNVGEGNVLKAQNVLVFDTAWSPPAPVLEALSVKFPAISFKHSWANEELGVGVGAVTYLSGKVMDSNIPENESKEAYELSAEIWGCDLAENNLRFDPKMNTYVYDETMNEPHPSLLSKVEAVENRDTNSPTDPEIPGKAVEPSR